MKTPWPDYRLQASIEDIVKEMEAIAHRRFIKCHVPLDGIPYDENVNYIHVSRELHDAFFSLRNCAGGSKKEVWNSVIIRMEKNSVKAY